VYGWYELLVEGKGDLEVEDLNSKGTASARTSDPGAGIGRVRDR
jgi:hypothetical protein